MKKLLLLLLSLVISVVVHGQSLKINMISPYIVKEDREDKPISIPIKLEKATKDCSVSFEIDEQRSSATLNKDYTITPANKVIELTKSNDFSGKVDLVIKADDFSESSETIVFKFKFKDESNIQKESEFIVIISDVNDGSQDQPIYTEAEKQKNRNLSIEIFTGGAFDFFDALKFQKMGGELVVTVNDIAGRDSRLGGFIGVSNFQNFTLDSSNANVRVQRVRIDTGAYVSGKTKYIERTYIDHRKLTINQWGYYVNPTYRINKQRSDFFNVYVSFRMEALKASTQTEYKTDTVNFADTTNRPLGNSPVFQSGKGFLLQKVLDTHTSGYFSFGLPMFLNSKDKFKLYFDPNLGIAVYNYSRFMPSADRRSLLRTNYNVTKAFYLFRFRVTEQFSGLNITIGGEIRDLFPSYNPTINAYLGIRVNMLKWFKKDNT
ncbi:MAG: hypothetical protein JWR67_2730 [Mucilaginibacter sp.]|nr:hypothetical protein [Mucilaginibacter sp.]